MRSDISGKIEVVRLTELVRPDLFRGKTLNDGKDVSVNAHRPYEPIECLVRFSLDQIGPTPIGNFITSNIPTDFKSLQKDGYVLIGIWEERMIQLKMSAFPTLKKIDMYYAPGDRPIAIFLTETQVHKNFELYVGYSISNEWIAPFKTELKYLLKYYLPNPEGACKFVIGPESKKLSCFERDLREYGLVPIRMEPKQILK
jgi:hypothetical protein